MNDREPDPDAYLNELNDYFSRVAKNCDGLKFQILMEKRKSKGSLELVAGSFQSLLTTDSWDQIERELSRVFGRL